MQTLTLDRSDMERRKRLVLAGLDYVQEQLQVVRAGTRELIDKYDHEDADARQNADLTTPSNRTADLDRRAVG